MARSTRRSSPARRKRVWARDRFSLSITGGTGPAQTELLASLESLGVGATALGWTVGPVILSGVMVRRTSVTVTANDQVALGIRMASSQIEAVDQDPLTNSLLDWMFWSAVPTPDAQNTALYQDSMVAGSNQWGTRSMRKLDEMGESLWIVGAGQAAATTFVVSGYASTLCILS